MAIDGAPGEPGRKGGSIMYYLLQIAVLRLREQVLEPCEHTACMRLYHLSLSIVVKFALRFMDGRDKGHRCKGPSRSKDRYITVGFMRRLEHDQDVWYAPILSTNQLIHR